MLLVACIGLLIFFIVICLCLVFEIGEEQVEKNYMHYLDAMLYNKSIYWTNTIIQDILYQYRYHYNINENEQLYIKVYYKNKVLDDFDIIHEHKFDKIKIITDSDIKQCQKNNVPVGELLNYTTILHIDKYGNIKYDI